MNTNENHDAQPEDTQPETWPRVIKLQYPITFGSETISELTFRRGRIGDLRGIKVDSVPAADQLVLIMSRMSGQPVAVIERLDVEDAGPAMAVAIGFFAKCLTTGA